MAPEVSDPTERDGEIRVVFLDIGGVMYDDSVYARSWARALRESGARLHRRGVRRGVRGRARRAGRIVPAPADLAVPGAGRRHRAGGGDRDGALGATRPTRCTPTCCPASSGWPAATAWASSRTSRAWCGRRWSATGSTGSSRCGACPTTSGSRSPIPRFFAHVLYLAGEAPPHAVDGRRPPGLRRASGAAGRACERCGCCAARRPTTPRPSSWPRPTRRSADWPSSRARWNGYER